MQEIPRFSSILSIYGSQIIDTWIDVLKKQYLMPLSARRETHEKELQTADFSFPHLFHSLLRTIQCLGDDGIVGVLFDIFLTFEILTNVNSMRYIKILNSRHSIND